MVVEKLACPRTNLHKKQLHQKDESSLSPLTEDQLHQIRDDRKEQIMLAGAKVFARKGIIGAKMSMIAKEAGISSTGIRVRMLRIGQALRQQFAAA